MRRVAGRGDNDKGKGEEGEAISRSSHGITRCRRRERAQGEGLRKESCLSQNINPQPGGQ